MWNYNNTKNYFCYFSNMNIGKKYKLCSKWEKVQNSTREMQFSIRSLVQYNIFHSESVQCLHFFVTDKNILTSFLIFQFEVVNLISISNVIIRKFSIVCALTKFKEFVFFFTYILWVFSLNLRLFSFLLLFLRKYYENCAVRIMR